jgi:hypothetical protein
MVAGLLQKKLHTPFYVSNYYKEVLAVLRERGKWGWPPALATRGVGGRGIKVFFWKMGYII